MSKYVEQYRKLEEHASALEERAEDYKSRAEDDRWEQCRIAFEATTSTEFTQVAFAEAVGKSQSHIQRQVTMWRRYPTRGNRPTYWEAQAAIRHHSTGEDRTREMAREGVRRLPPEDKRQVARELAEDPDVADEVVDAVSDNPKLTAQVNERAAEKRSAPRKKTRDPSNMDLAAHLGVGHVLAHAVNKREDSIDIIVGWLRENDADDATIRAVVEDIRELKASGDRLHMYAEELQVALDGGVSDERIAQFVEGR